LSALSLLVGAYYAIKDRHENDKENYYFGKHSMSPVSLKNKCTASYPFNAAWFLIQHFLTTLQDYGNNKILFWLPENTVSAVTKRQKIR